MQMNQEEVRVSVLYTEHVKEPESLFDEELGTHVPGLLCIRLLSSSYESSLGHRLIPPGGVESDSIS